MIRQAYKKVHIDSIFFKRFNDISFVTIEQYFLFVITMGMHRTFLFDGTRECICKLYSSGTNVSNIAKILSIPRVIISTIIQKFKKSGNSQRKLQPGRKEKLNKRDQRTLGRLIGVTELKIYPQYCLWTQTSYNNGRK